MCSSDDVLHGRLYGGYVCSSDDVLHGGPYGVYACSSDDVLHGRPYVDVKFMALLFKCSRGNS